MHGTTSSLLHNNMQQIKPITMENNLSKDRPHNQLQLDSPRLPSARRSVSSSIDNSTNQPNLTRDASSSKLSMMVPFSWESSPGVPKDLGQRDMFSDKELDQLPPKPPPCRWQWHPSNGDATNNCDRDLSEGSSEYGDASSDAFDRVSLSEQLGIAGRLSSFRGLGLKDIEAMRSQSPSFIMDRFLPAANAIASSSVLKRPKRTAQRNEQITDKEMPIPQTNNGMVQMVPISQNIEIHKEMSSRACGLMVFFPWKMKPIVCGFKNPAYKNRMPDANISFLAPNNPSEVHDLRLFDKRPSYRERLSQGFGLPFLDTSRLPSKKTLNKLMQRDVKEDHSKRNIEKKNGRNNNLPVLKPPAESWLSHTLGSANKGS